MRKHVALVMAAALAASSLAGCSGKTSAPAETTVAAAETKAEETKAEESKAEETTAEAASTDELSEDELIEQAKAEGKVVIYSATSVMEKVAELFKAKYGIDVEVTQLGDSEMIEKVSSEAQAGVSGGADAILCQDGARVISELITPGYTQNYLSSRITDVVPEEDQNPLVFQFCNKVFIFNNEKVDDTAYTNIWQFTDPQYKGLLQMKDANSEGVNMNFFTMLTRDDYAQQLADAYKEYYGKDIELTTPNAGYEWIKAIYANGLVLGTSDTKISEAVGAKGQDASPVGLFTLNKYGKKDEKGLALAIADQMSPIQGFYYPMYAQLTSYAEHPAAAKLFIEYLYTEEGWSPYAKRVGDYNANRSLPAGPGDQSIDEWDKVLIKEDAEWVYENRRDVEDFIQTIAQ